MAGVAHGALPRSEPLIGRVPLRILHLEDDADDAEIVRAALTEEGLHFSIERVTERSEYLAALRRGGIDLILAEYQLPLFDGVGALAIAHELRREIPFIFVSGTLGEEIAVEMLKSGAIDFVIKRRMSRLGAAVRRALDDVARRVEYDRLEDLLHQAQKMEVVGRLAGRVAHGFNDLLTVILGRGESLRSRLGRDDPAQADSEQIVRAAILAAALSRKLLAFSGKQLLEPKAVDLNQTVREMEGVLKRLLGDEIELVLSLVDTPARVRVDPGQWEQTIINLAMNGREAMAGGGTLMVETGHVTLDGVDASGKGLARGPYVTISVSDTGRGMDAETRAHLFEPFFTTKEPGQGAGLGISAVQGIVEQSGGHIEVFSEVGRGTMIRILLPYLDVTPSRESDAHGAGPGTDAGFESTVSRTGARPIKAYAGPPAAPNSILLVEDEPMVREMVSLILREAGYQVFEASGGEEALEFSERYPNALALLLTDVVMPRLGGPELVRRLAPLQPAMRVIYMSGYTDDRAFQQGLLVSGAAFLSKPFGPKELLVKVATVFDQAATTAA